VIIWLYIEEKKYFLKMVLLISKLTTTNIGNVALTNELFRLYETRLGAAHLGTLGRPLGLYRMDLDEILNSKDPVSVLEAWSDDVLRKFSKSTVQSNAAPVLKWARLIAITEKTFLKERIKGKFKKALNRVRYHRVYNTPYENRIWQIRHCKAVIYSGAGEVSDNDTFLRQLIELRVIQKLGIDTYAINQSLNIRNKNFELLVNHIYGKMAGIVVRGDVSKSLLERIGIRPEKITVAPDTAILTHVGAFQVPTKKVGLNFTPYIDIDYMKLDSIVNYLKSLNYELEFITNDHYGDQHLAETFEARYQMKLMPKVKDHLEYGRYLQQFEFVISTRLHTNIIAIASGVPSIPIEGHFYKTKEVLALFNYPVPVVDKNVSGWEDQLLVTIKDRINSMDQLRELIQKQLPQWRALAEANVVVTEGL